MSLVQIGMPSTRGSKILRSGPVLSDRSRREIRYLRLSLSDRCNLSCTYCRPPQGIEHVRRADILTHEEIELLVREFVRWGIDRLRLTGGEPTVRGGLVELVARLADIETGRLSHGGKLEVVMTTNGELIAPMAQSLNDAGLAGVTVSVDSLDEQRYRAITRTGRLERLMAGIEALCAAGFKSIKLNTVALMGFNGDELAEIAAFAWKLDIIPRFIELMPMSAGELFVPGKLMAAEVIRQRIAVAHGAALEVERRPVGRALGPADYRRLRGGPFDGRRFGTIAAMTENFCDGCNRIRITTTGHLHACLARDDARDLRAALRTSPKRRGRALEDAVRGALLNKKDAHGFESDGGGGPMKAMISIGG